MANKFTDAKIEMFTVADGTMYLVETWTAWPGEKGPGTRRIYKADYEIREYDDVDMATAKGGPVAAMEFVGWKLVDTGYNTGRPETAVERADADVKMMAE